MSEPKCVYVPPRAVTCRQEFPGDTNEFCDGCMQDEVADLRARLDEATRERDEAKAEASRVSAKCIEVTKDFHARTLAAESRVSALEAALTPFARYWTDSCIPEHHWPETDLATAPVVEWLMLVDFRRAAAAIQAKEGA